MARKTYHCEVACKQGYFTCQKHGEPSGITHTGHPGDMSAQLVQTKQSCIFMQGFEQQLNQRPITAEIMKEVKVREIADAFNVPCSSYNANRS